MRHIQVDPDGLVVAQNSIPKAKVPTGGPTQELWNHKNAINWLTASLEGGSASPALSQITASTRPNLPAHC